MRVPAQRLVKASPVRRIKTSLAVVALLLLTACQVHRHRVGTGPVGVGSESMRQFYIFFGLLRISESDSQRLTQEATGYEIVTEYSLIDMLLQPFLLPVTMTSRTITVKR